MGHIGQAVDLCLRFSLWYWSDMIPELVYSDPAPPHNVIPSGTLVLVVSRDSDEYLKTYWLTEPPTGGSSPNMQLHFF
ncbi:hypothetical protein BGZ88_008769 [Linnemannia elongata]|nr:hypothetical protein BGZ88_008769 [Linnemannia elongata]